MKIALIAHDRKKDSLVEFAIAYKEILQQHGGVRRQHMEHPRQAP